ncbi:hypothetical protein AgCh_017242 [Apium graveolens]
MLTVLQELPELSAEDPLFHQSLRNLGLVQTSDGTLKSCPAILYDPRNEELYDLLEDSGSFPSELRMFSRAANSLRSRHLKSDLEKFWMNSGCPNKDGFLRSEKGPWNDLELMKPVHIEEARIRSKILSF